jgi:hypothetical protein
LGVSVFGKTVCPRYHPGCAGNVRGCCKMIWQNVYLHTTGLRNYNTTTQTLVNQLLAFSIRIYF